MINSRFPLVSATLTPSTPQGHVRVRAPLLPKLRGHFAEFLNHDSLERLSILYLITCVGLGYGRLEPHVDAFLGSIGSPNPPPKGSHHVSSYMSHGFTKTRPTRLDQDYHRLARLPSCVTPVNTLTSLDQVPRIPPQPHTTKWRMRNGWNRWLVSPVQYGRFFAGTGISTRCPSTTPVGLALGPDSPWED